MAAIFRGKGGVDLGEEEIKKFRGYLLSIILSLPVEMDKTF